MLSAIRSNNVKKMQKCRGQLKAWPPHRRHCGAYIEEAIKLGHLEALQWLYWQLKERGRQRRAIAHNQRAILEWLMDHDQAYCGEHLLSMALAKDDLELLEWLHARGCHPREDALHAAVRKNRVDLLEWAKARGAVDALTIGPHYEDVQHRLVVAAVRTESLESLAWLHANGIEWDERTMKEAFDSLQPQILQYLHEHGCPWSERIWDFDDIYRSFSAHFLERGIGALWFMAEKRDRFVACLRYLLAHGCPCDPVKRAGLLRCLGKKVLLPKWRAVVRWMIRVRPYAWHWLEEHEKVNCAPGGKGRKRDRELFEADFA